ncbi:MAG: hypothetical protein KBC96_11995 [Armatimonadetes bacterium]|nr:hypothetical protein [Armatimonadota bacterium]
MLLLLTTLLIVCAAPALAGWTQDKFEIGAWRTPSAEFSTDDVYARMSSAGFTMLIGPPPEPGGNIDVNLRCLNLCQKYGMRLLVKDVRIHPDPQTDADRNALDAMVGDYAGHPALYGYYIKDEPTPAAYRLLVEAHTYLKQKDPKHLPYINLFPNYGGPHQIEFADYDGYVADFVKTVKPLMLSYDHYSFLRDGRNRDNWFANLEVVRRDSLSAGIPMWVIIQALEDATRYRPPTLNQMYWQVNTSLAHGAKSIWYFPYWSAGEVNKPEEWHYLGVVMPDGKPGPQYEAACEINPKLKRLGPTLMGLKSVSVVHMGEVPLRAKGFRPDDLIADASGGRIVIGRFKDKLGEPVLMLVNRDWDDPGKVRLTLKQGSGVEEIGRLGPGKPFGPVRFDAQSKELSVTLAPGEARIIGIRD